MKSRYTAVIQRDCPWWIGWCLEMNRTDSLAAINGDYEEVELQG
jgi:hypothetical protein